MNHDVFGWDFENIQHIARHQVAPEEAEDVLEGDPLDLGEEVIDGELRFASLGSTRQGSILTVVYTFRRDRIRVVTS